MENIIDQLKKQEDASFKYGVFFAFLTVVTSLFGLKDSAIYAALFTILFFVMKGQERNTRLIIEELLKNELWKKASSKKEVN